MQDKVEKATASILLSQFWRFFCGSWLDGQTQMFDIPDRDDDEDDGIEERSVIIAEPRTGTQRAEIQRIRYDNLRYGTLEPLFYVMFYVMK